MNLPLPPSPGPADALDAALAAWAAEPLPDQGFTQQVLHQVARLRAGQGLGGAEALARLQAQGRRSRQHRRAWRWGLGLGLVPAMAWGLLGGAGGSPGFTEPWLMALATCLGSAVAAAALLLHGPQGPD